MTPSTLPDTSKGVTEAMVEAALAAYSDGPYSTHEGKMWAAIHAALSPLPAPEPTEGIAELVGRLNAQAKFYDDLREREFDAPSSDLDREAASALTALQAERDDLDRRLNEEQMQTANGGEIINDLKGQLAEAEQRETTWRESAERLQAERDEAVDLAEERRTMSLEWKNACERAEAELAAMKEGAARPEVSIKPMQLSDDRCDYFVSFKHGDREVTPHVFRERFKAEYHVALYRWLFEGSDEPKIVDFNHGEWPARTYTDDERRAFAAFADKGVVEELLVKLWAEAAKLEPSTRENIASIIVALRAALSSKESELE